jgi:arylsulfatase A-like enzyme
MLIEEGFMQNGEQKKQGKKHQGVAGIGLSLILMAVQMLASIPVTAAQTPTETERPPNIVIILADDLGYGDIGAYDGWIKTPNLDRMAREGLRFTDFYSSGSVCSPTRAGLLTGRYQQRAGIPGVIQAEPEENRHHGLQASEITLAERLGEAGYATAIFGKWHLGYTKEYNPVYHGFDRFRGFVSGNVDFFAHVDGVGFYDWWDGDRLVNEPGYVTHLLTQHAVDFIENHADQPFLLYLPHEAPHAPFQGPNDEPFRIIGKRMGYGPYGNDADALQKRSAFREMVEELDAGVGAVLDTLDRLGLAENTLVFFFSDNGGLGNVGSNGALRGHKAQLWEGGIRVPAMATWPGRIAAGSTDQPAISIDLMPTMLALAGISMPQSHQLDGTDLSPLLFEQQKLSPRTLFWQFNHRSAVRQGDWKLVRDTSAPDEISLFDLTRDLGEERNLANKHPQRVKEMLAAFEAWQEDVTSAGTAEQKTR